GHAVIGGTDFLNRHEATRQGAKSRRHKQGKVARDRTALAVDLELSRLNKRGLKVLKRQRRVACKQVVTRQVRGVQTSCGHILTHNLGGLSLTSHTSHCAGCAL